MLTPDSLLSAAAEVKPGRWSPTLKAFHSSATTTVAGRETQVCNRAPVGNPTRKNPEAA
jgi:hypothetical protein